MQTETISYENNSFLRSRYYDYMAKTLKNTSLKHSKRLQQDKGITLWQA
jgi:hypothetical protein